MDLVLSWDCFPLSNVDVAGSAHGEAGVHLRVLRMQEALGVGLLAAPQSWVLLGSAARHGALCPLRARVGRDGHRRDGFHSGLEFSGCGSGFVTGFVTSLKRQSLALSPRWL